MTVSDKPAYNAADMAGRPPSKAAPVFGQRLAAIRKDRGFSQQRFADMLETSRANVAYYERSAKNPTMDLVHRCAETLGCKVSDLIDDSAEPPKKKRGPKSELEQRFELVAKLPRSKQREILKVVDALLAQAS